MKVLKFKGKYKSWIISGRKRSTIRMETSLNPGDLVYLEAGEERIGEAIIREVRELSLGEIDDDLAREDGFQSVDDLIDELISIYGDEIFNRRLKLIRFDLIGRD
ncbi:ASCH domain-containing protein [Candidatus Korarchaeum cryptofilum]|jgi:hypothetical protein|uniref:ASCH domain-containing protein n=2 Tax=Candidatus Korarchaeum cryptofilum TaxID=498846 RepID=B1L5S0_KORCO|nr:ASCH domain-containing protein [Candidatus Korarchaeum cryptofilum]ACB07799.1 protein of unknown function DUF437 [Candidatus Korarchaeum cryptofilum OPF8]RSN70533.1 ASCH domain-containing protein [Candidatus Korarchaeum cryptofilum]